MRKMRRQVVIGLGLIAMALGMIWPAGHVRADVSSGVFVCLGSHYDRQSFSCSRRDTTIGADSFASTMLVVYGQDGQNFTSTTSTLTLSTVAGAVATEVGRTTARTQLSSSAYSWNLSSAFSAFGTSPVTGTTYKLEADETDGAQEVLLGTATFTVVPRSQPASGPLLVFRCLATTGTNVDCRLQGRGFVPLESVHISYAVTIRDSQDAPLTITYRRTGRVGANGSFTRPLFSFYQNAVYQTYSVKATAVGVGGDRASASAKG